MHKWHLKYEWIFATIMVLENMPTSVNILRTAVKFYTIYFILTWNLTLTVEKLNINSWWNMHFRYLKNDKQFLKLQFILNKWSLWQLTKKIEIIYYAYQYIRSTWYDKLWKTRQIIKILGIFKVDEMFLYI